MLKLRSSKISTPAQAQIILGILDNFSRLTLIVETNSNGKK
jgi:hypothetical protein